jgi:hypothetical protein
VTHRLHHHRQVTSCFVYGGASHVCRAQYCTECFGNPVAWRVSRNCLATVVRWLPAALFDGKSQPSRLSPQRTIRMSNRRRWLIGAYRRAAFVLPCGLKSGDDSSRNDRARCENTTTRITHGGDVLQSPPALSLLQTTQNITVSRGKDRQQFPQELRPLRVRTLRLWGRSWLLPNRSLLRSLPARRQMSPA